MTSGRQTAAGPIRRNCNMASWAYRALVSSVLGMSLIASACGSSGGGSSSSSASKGTVTVAGFNFAESSILANVYGGALKGAGYTVNYKLNLGSREVVEPALEKGDIDLYPGYAATELEFINKGRGEGPHDAAATVAKLNPSLEPKGLKALNPPPATDENAFAVLKSGKYGTYKTLSELVPVAPQMTLGGPPECPNRPFCQAGLQRVYGLNFKAFKPLDAGGPLTKAALDKGAIDIGLIFSSDSAYSTGKYVQLQDDKHLQNADNVVPLGRSKVLTGDATTTLNNVSAKLTTDDLIQMNKKADVDKADPDQIAATGSRTTASRPDPDLTWGRPERPPHFSAERADAGRREDHLAELGWEIVMPFPMRTHAQLALEEVLLDRIVAGLRGPTLRFWEWAEPSLVLGSHEVLANEVELEAARKQRFKVGGRMSGGGTMLVEPGRSITSSPY